MRIFGRSGLVEIPAGFVDSSVDGNDGVKNDLVLDLNQKRSRRSEAYNI